MTGWRPTGGLSRCLAVGAVGLGLAVAFGDAVLVVLTAPFLLLGALGLLQRPDVESRRHRSRLDHQWMHEGQGTRSRLLVVRPRRGRARDPGGDAVTVRRHAPGPRPARPDRCRGLRTSGPRDQPEAVGTADPGSGGRRAHQPVGGLPVGPGPSGREPAAGAAGPGAVRLAGRGAAAARPGRCPPLATASGPAASSPGSVRSRPATGCAGSTGGSRCGHATCTS